MSDNVNAAVSPELKGLAKLAKRIQEAQAKASHRTKMIVGSLVTAGILGGSGYGVYKMTAGASEVQPAQVSTVQGKEVKVLFSIAGGLKTQNRVLLNNFTVPRGTRFADYHWQPNDLTVVIDKTSPLYGQFQGDQRGRISQTGTYEVIGTAATYNGHPQIIAKEMKLVNAR